MKASDVFDRTGTTAIHGPTVKEIDREQRRARLGVRHFLARPADEPAVIADGLVAIHSSDPTTVFLSMWARLPSFRVAHLEDLLYEQRALVRHWAMRRTLWVMSRQMLSLAVGSSTRPLAARETKKTAHLIEQGGIADDGQAWLEDAASKVLEILRERGEALTRDLSKEIPELAEKIEFRNKAGKLIGTTGLSSRVLVQLGMESKALRTRPAGSWVSGQYRWAETETWLGGPIDDIPLREASARLLRSWLTAYGPATETDVRWWTGWPVAQVRTALDDVGAVEVDLAEDGKGYVLPDDVDDVAEPASWVAFLPSLDTTVMGWKERAWYLGQHSQILFDRNGNAGPTVWADGRVVGGWAQREDGEVVYELLEKIGRDVEDRTEARRRELQEWLGEVTVRPRFRSPHHIELSS